MCNFLHNVSWKETVMIVGGTELLSCCMELRNTTLELICGTSHVNSVVIFTSNLVW